MNSLVGEKFIEFDCTHHGVDDTERKTLYQRRCRLELTQQLPRHLKRTIVH